MTEPGNIDPARWANMDPLVRTRFHELANHITRQDGVIAGLSMRVPERPEAIPVLQVEVSALKESHRDLASSVKGIDDKLDSLLLRIVGATTVMTVLGTLAVNLITR